MKITAIAALSAALFASSLHAISFDASINGIIAPGGATFVPYGGDLGTKSFNGTTVLGVTGGFAQNEIDLDQSLEILFDEDQYITELSIGLLYDGPEFLDNMETAVVLVNGTSMFELQAIGFTTATWSGSGSVTNLSPANSLGGALWSIENPFGDLRVSSLYFYPVATGATRADFGIASFETARVPDSASTVALLGLALVGLATFARRKS